MSVLSGLEVLRREVYQRLAGKRVGVLTNPSAIDRQLRSAYNLLTSASEVDVRALFGPEHGFAGSAPAGANVVSTTDPRTGLPVHSLYGNAYRPTSAMLEGLDVLVCDIQDIGVRYYTYTWTVSHALEAAGKASIDIVILDRPNPSGGVIVEGPLLQPKHTSLVGRFAVPVRHGLTLGELSRLINNTWNPTPANLDVVPCEGWQRDMSWEASGLPWVPPSPNMPHLSSLYQYPGSCLIEGTNLSEGRGTTLPFEVVGAPWIDGQQLAAHLNAEAWGGEKGARFRQHAFHPTSSKFAGQYINGIQVYITDFQNWQPLLVWLGIIATIRTLHPREFRWKANHFDRLIGSTTVRQQIDAVANSGIPVVDLLAQWQEAWQEDVSAFEQQRHAFLMYP